MIDTLVLPAIIHRYGVLVTQGVLRMHPVRNVADLASYILFMIVGDAQ